MAYTSINSEITNLIQQSLIGTIGTDIFIGHFPPDPDNAVMVLPVGGDEQDMYLDTNYALIDFWSRDRYSEVSYDKLLRIFKQLHRLQNVQFGHFYVYFIHATGNILDMDSDGQGRKLHKLTFRVIYRDTQLIS